MNKNLSYDMMRILSGIRRLQAELEDYKVLSMMSVDELETLLAELVREELSNQSHNSWDNSGFSRKMRVQNVLSERR